MTDTLFDKGFAADLSHDFLADIPECWQVDLDTWERRGIGAKVMEFCASLFKEQV